MPNPARKRDRLWKLLGRKDPPAASSPSGLARSAAAASSSSGAHAGTRCTEVLASIRAVLNVAEKVLDGCPIWGPKAAVAAAAESLKAVQTFLENEDGISDVVEAVRKMVEVLAPSVPILPPAVSPELKARISAHVSELEKIRAETAEWSKEEKHLMRRLLDAERVAGELKTVMGKIHEANERFLIETAVRTEIKVETIDQNVMDVRERDLLNLLRPVNEAFHDASNASEMCLAGTREQLLLDLTAWFDDRDPSRERVFWLNGLAGTGKTTMARTISARAHKQGRLAATFFFSRNIAATRAPSVILPTIAYQLAHYQEALRSSVCTAIASDEAVSTRVIAAQANILFDKIALVGVSDEPLLIVVDALDECYVEGSCEGGDAIPLLLTKLGSLPYIKILITSRVEDTIKRMFECMANQLALHNIEADIVRGDIHLYLEHCLTSLAHARKLPLPFPTSDALDELVKRAGTLFIYAATVVKWVSDPKAQPTLRLQQVLEQDVDEVAFQHRMLDGMYAQILVQAAKTTGNPKPHERALRKVLSATVLLQEPMPPSALAVLVDEEKRAAAILSLLSAVLMVDNKAPVRLFHPSFPDFITNEERCKDARFLVSRSEGHVRLATRCLKIMNLGLCRDICDIQDPSLLNSEVVDLEERLARAVPSELRYACQYWHIHLQHAGVFSNSDLLAVLETFCAQHLLHWVEVLSLVNKLPSVRVELESLLPHLGRSELRDSTAYTLLADTERLILAYLDPINESALQVYHSAVATMPSCLLWETLGQHCEGIPMLVSQRALGWGPRVKIIYNNANAAVFSPDNRFILSRSNSAQLWDVATGTQMYSTSDASGDCTAVAFSPDGQSVLCGFRDGTVEVWTIATWAKQAVLPWCSNGEVVGVTFTPDSQSVVSAYEDGTVRLWALTQQTQQVFTTGYRMPSPYNTVFSFDCRFIAVTQCDDGTARVWKLIPGAPPEPLVIAGLGDKLYRAAAFSPDGCSVVFGSVDHGLHVWDTAMGTQRSTINGHSGAVMALAFSRDGQFLVSGSEDGTIMVWNFTAGAQQPDYVLKGHHRMVSSVAFSPNAKLVVSTSFDGTMRVWSGAVSVDESVMEGHTGAVETTAFSHDGRHIASGSKDSTIRVWDAVTGRQKHILEGHENDVWRVVFSPDSQTVASCSEDHTVRTWDVATGTQVHAVLHHPWTPYDVVFSHDGQSILAINDYAWGERRGVLEAYVWDVATGTQKCVISYSSSQLFHQDPNPVIFSPSDRLLVATLHSQTDSSSSDGSDEESTSSSSGKSDEESTSSRSGGSDEESTSTRSGGSDKETIDHKVWDASTGVELAVQDLAPALARDMDGALLSRDEQSVAPYHTLMSDGWILVSQDEDRYHWHGVCWLPAERQPMISPSLLYAYHDQKVCIGAGNGAVTILDLSNVPMPWAR